ncbi:hypothetical protein AAZV13_02G148700 [Glycine max]
MAGRSGPSFALKTRNEGFFQQHCMKQWLRQVCTSLNIPAPSIVLSDIKFNDEVEFRRYCGTLIRSFDGNQLSHVRRYALTDYDAQEDVCLLPSDPSFSFW